LPSTAKFANTCKTLPLMNADEADQEKEPLKKAAIEGGGAT